MITLLSNIFVEHEWVVGVEIKQILLMISGYFCSKPVMSTSLRVWWFTVLNAVDRYSRMHPWCTSVMLLGAFR